MKVIILKNSLQETRSRWCRGKYFSVTLCHSLQRYLFFYRYDIIVFILLVHNTCSSDRDFTNRNSYSNQWFDKSLLGSN